ncbi:MAG: Fic family protein [Saprospiraceae bacterium]|nr:Fic family protein [Candidatus Vicinibacter affinis]MBK7302277.1 Fic family protein [Candidatus Vicinibacter affinis]MBK7798235.1 Fic family protein [Candidatus Vicinibacter affinis]MBK8404754.1 Fic family protein [Candidatus Vicinibacter affinis]
MINNRFSLKITVFHGRMSPEEGFLVGYGALLEAYKLEVPVPDVLALISTKKREYKTDEWQVFTSRYLPEDSLYKHLIFALKYEGINLLLLKKLFEKLSEEETLALIKQEPTGQYSRRLWFLYEWLLKKQLDTEDIQLGNYIPLVDMELQFAITKGEKSVRHRIINNLPGINGFCPLIRKTDKLNQYIEKNISTHTEKYIKDIHAEVLKRASAFLLLKDSKASFTIEGESPKSKRMARWGQAIGQAGRIELNKEELLRLQQIIIENPRFVDMGFRNKGGFIGEHDRITGEPLPDHISAKWQDLDHLMTSLIQTNQMLLKSDMDAVLSAAITAFGFVFIHPFEDGNGRLHRYLIHHILSKKQFSKQGMIFPVSASILDHIVDYRKVLEAYSLPLLDYIDWRETNDHNIEVLNDTMDYYAYFDATKQAEFMYDCVMDTIENIIPREVNYIIRYDQFKRYIEDEFEMPDKLVALLVRFLEQNGGSLSKRAKENEFDKLNEEEISKIETEYQKIFT